MKEIYRFHVEGHLDQSWSSWLGDTQMQHEADGTTTFLQAIPDQAALYGVLLKLSNSGVPLIGARRLSDPDGTPRSRRGPTDTNRQNTEESMLQQTATKPSRADDETAIRSAVATLEAGWNAGDGEQFAAPFAADADYVVVDGRYIQGRQAIAQGHQHIFDTVYRDSHNTGTLERVRFLGDDVAIAHVRWHLKLGSEDARNTAICTMVLARSEGDWNIAAFHNTPVLPRAK